MNKKTKGKIGDKLFNENSQQNEWKFSPNLELIVEGEPSWFNPNPIVNPLIF